MTRLTRMTAPRKAVTTMIDPGSRVCANCAFVGVNRATGKPECWHDPPAVVGQALLRPPLIPGGPPQIEWHIQAVRPAVPKDGTCGRFRIRRAIVDGPAN